MATIPGRREARKPKKEKHLKLVAENEYHSPWYRMQALAPKHIEARGKGWTEKEVHEIIKFQNYALGFKGLGLDGSDFKRLWARSNGLCAVTGVNFSTIDYFPFGVHHLKRSDTFKLHNFELVLLPLIMMRRSTPCVPKLPAFERRPMSRAFALLFTQELLKTPMVKRFGVDIKYSASAYGAQPYGSLYDIVLHTKLTLEDRHVFDGRTDRVGRDTQIMTVTIDDTTGIMEVEGPFDQSYQPQASICLATPGLDPLPLVKALFDESYRLVLKRRCFDIMKIT